MINSMVFYVTDTAESMACGFVNMGEQPENTIMYAVIESREMLMHAVSYFGAAYRQRWGVETEDGFGLMFEHTMIISVQATLTNGFELLLEPMEDFMERRNDLPVELWPLTHTVVNSSEQLTLAVSLYIEYIRAEHGKWLMEGDAQDYEDIH